MFRQGRRIASLAQQIKHAFTSPSLGITAEIQATSITTIAAQRLSQTQLHKLPYWKQLYRSQWTDGRGYTHFRSRQQFFNPRRPSDMDPQRAKRMMYLVVVAGAGGTVVYFSSLQEIPYTHRKHSILIDVNTERELGEQTFQQVLQEAAANRTLLPRNHPATLAVKRVGSRIAAVAGDGYGGGFVDQMKGIKWEFAVIQSPEANAFVVPGGKVVVYTGLLRMLSSEDELAAVIGHEVGHVVARHAAERMTQGSFIELFRFLAYIVLGIPVPSIVSAAFFLPNSRKAETEADAIGIQLAARSCYNPEAAATVFQKLGEAEKRMGADRMPKMLRTHPVTSDRIKNIYKMLATAENLYVSSGCGDKQTLLAEFQSRLGGTIKPVDWNSVHKHI